MFELFGFTDSPGARVTRAVWPAAVLVLWFIGGLIAYAARTLVRGEFRDVDMEAKGSTPLLSIWLRRYFVWVVRPFWLLIERSGIPASALTTLSAMIAVASGVALAAGHFALGGWLYIVSGILDVFDGRLARLRGTSGSAGAVLDSVLDRYSDAAVLIGLSWFYRHSWVLIPALMALSGAFIVSYVRAKGESEGLKVTVGVMQRPERVIALGCATAFSPVVAALWNPTDPEPTHWLAVAGIVFLALSTQWTAAHRFVHVLRKLSKAPSVKLVDFGRNGLPRAIVSAAVATLSDFGVVLFLVESALLEPALATAVGCLVGACIGFLVSRVWAFVGQASPLLQQLRRYLLVSSSSAALNAGGVAVLLLLPDLDYRIAWVVVRGAVFVLWNYPLQKDYVFPHGVEARCPHGAVSTALP